MTIKLFAPFNKNRCNLCAGPYQLERCTEIVYELAVSGRIPMQGTESKLDWSRMLGFEQITDRRSTLRELSKLGAKVGGKIGNKPGLKG